MTTCHCGEEALGGWAPWVTNPCDVHTPVKCGRFAKVEVRAGLPLDPPVLRVFWHQGEPTVITAGTETS